MTAQSGELGAGARVLWALVRWVLPADERHDFLCELMEEAGRLPGGGSAQRRWIRRQLFSSILPSGRRGLELLVRVFLDDMFQAGRALRGSTRTVLLVAVTLGVGLGAVSTVFGVLRAVVLVPLPYPSSDELYVVKGFQPQRSADLRGVAGPDFYDFQDALASSVSLGAFDRTSATLARDGGPPIKLEVAAANREAFGLAEVAPLIGRTFSRTEDAPDEASVVILSEELWRTSMGGDPSVLGTTIDIGGVRYTVIGVMPRSFGLPHKDVALWTPLGDSPRGLHRRAQVLDVIVRLPDEGSLRFMEQRLEEEALRLSSLYPDTNSGRTVALVPLIDELVGSDGRSLGMLLIGALALLAVAFFNTLGIILARVATRRPELDLRRALGAPAGRIRRQLWIETSGMLGVALAAGLILSSLGLQSAASVWPADTFRADAITLDGRVFLFSVVLVLAMAALVPFVPSLRGQENAFGRGGTLQSHARLSLISAQLAMALVLFGGAVLLLTTLSSLSTVDRGVDVEALLVARVDLPAERYPTGMARYPDWPEVHAFYKSLSAELSLDPGIESVALSGSGPIRRAGFRVGVGLRNGAVHDTVEAAVQMVSSQWRSTVGLELVEGRDLSSFDRAGGEPVALVNEAFRRSFPSSGGWTGSVEYLGKVRRIVGVIEDVLPVPGSVAQPTVYSPLAQTPSELVTVILRTRGDPGSLVGVVRTAAAAVDPSLAVYGEEALSSELAGALTRPALHSAIVTVFGTVGLLLVAMGLFAVVSQLVSSSRRTIGIRHALGASPWSVARALLSDVGIAVFVGLGVGLAVLTAAVPFLRRLVAETPKFDPGTMLIAGMTLMLVSVLAVLPPLWSAWRADPIEALRAD